MEAESVGQIGVYLSAVLWKIRYLSGLRGELCSFLSQFRGGDAVAAIDKARELCLVLLHSCIYRNISIWASLRLSMVFILLVDLN